MWTIYEELIEQIPEDLAIKDFLAGLIQEGDSSQFFNNGALMAKMEVADAPGNLEKAP